MKKQEILKNSLSVIRENKMLKNDGEGNIFTYNPNNGVWEKKTPLLARIWLAETLKTFNPLRDELDALRLELEENINFREEKLSELYETEYVIVKNGRLNLRTQKLEEFKQSMYDRISINCNFSGDAKIEDAPVFMNFVKTSLGISAANPSQNPKLKLLLEIMGYSLSNLWGAKKAAILLGPPHTGKSVILNFVENIIGTSFCRHLTLSDLSDKYRCGQMNGAHLLLSHEMKLGSLKRLDVIKAVISGDPITIEKKGVQAWDYIPRAKFLIAANSLPYLGEADVGGAFAERLIVLPFANRDTKEKDTKLLVKLMKEKDIIVSLALKSMQGFVENELVFESLPEAQYIIDEYKINGNPVTAFLEEKFIRTNNDSDFVGLYQSYLKYENFCELNAFNKCSATRFRQQLAQLGIEFQRHRLDSKSNPVSCILGLKRKDDKNWETEALTQKSESKEKDS